jgi:hypothetical protein
MSKLLRETRCTKCAARIQVPTAGSYKIECGKCGGMNTGVALPGRGRKAAAVPKAAPKPKKAAPKPTPPKAAPKPKAAAPEVVESTPEKEPFPEWRKGWKKALLYDLAVELGLDVNKKTNKDGIIEALEDAEEAHES